MSLTVFAIAAAHAVPVVLVGAISRRKGPTIITAVFVGAVGALTGSPVYMAIDIVAVVIGYLVASSFFRSSS